MGESQAESPAEPALPFGAMTARGACPDAPPGPYTSILILTIIYWSKNMAILRINGLSKSFGIKTVFENVSFDIRSGERIGLVGANGAGKTTLLKCIRGDEEYDKGSVKASDGAIIGYLRQDFNYTSRTIREEMEEAWRDVLFYKDRIEALTKEPSSIKMMRSSSSSMARRKSDLNF